jgi:ABC-type molybdate transport system substrate-binding protein
VRTHLVSGNRSRRSKTVACTLAAATLVVTLDAQSFRRGGPSASAQASADSPARDARRRSGPPGELNVCHAGSLLAAFTQIEEEFRKQHPEVTVTDTSGGSVDLVRRFAAGHLECDVIAPADYLVIDAMLKPARLADYTIVFASGRMVLAYTVTDPKAGSLRVSGSFEPPSSIPQVTAGWHDVLTAPGVRISGAHPFMDPGGYRAHMIFELAQAHHKVPGLHNALLQHYQVNVADPSSSAPAPALGRDFNFQFTYEHTAATSAKRDASYRYATLPPEIDLSNDAPSRSGGSSDPPVSITIPGLGIPGTSASVTIRASSVAWGLTISANSRNRENAIAFVSSLLGPVGRAALTANGPPPLPRARVTRSDYERLPAALQALTTAN